MSDEIKILSVFLYKFYVYKQIKNLVGKISSHRYYREEHKIIFRFLAIFYVYTCITKDSNMLPKIENYYKDLGFTTNVSEYSLSDTSLFETISMTDMLLKESDEIKEICKQSILKYKEG